ncbi:MAG: hypothetical protein ACF8SC_09295 [Phycisphaerales bacterium JB037]
MISRAADHPADHAAPRAATAPRRSRRGSAYLLVLAATTIVTAAGVGALLVQRASHRATKLAQSTADARAAALSGLELGAFVINTVPTWRSTFGEGTWIPGWTVGNATVTVTAYTADGSTWQTSTDSTQRIRLVATATAGDATQISTIEVETEVLPGGAIPALSYTAVAALGSKLNGGDNLRVNGAPVATNANFEVDGDLYGDAEARSALGSGGTVHGSFSAIASELSLPGSSAFQTYIDRGTVLWGIKDLKQCLLTPSANPFGFSNSRGIYVMRPDGDASIERSRIEGTLVVILPDGKKLQLQKEVLMEPAADGYPTLLVQGNVEIDLDSRNNLLEKDAGNLNPLTSPYQGKWDLDTADAYANTITGLIHATGWIKIRKEFTGEVIILSNNEIIYEGNDMTLTHDASLVADPPAGYATPGTTRPVADLATLQRLAQD